MHYKINVFLNKYQLNKILEFNNFSNQFESNLIKSIIHKINKINYLQVKNYNKLKCKKKMLLVANKFNYLIFIIYLF